MFPGEGGDDIVTLGDGNHVVLGGDGADDIVAGDGDNVVFGDHGSVDASFTAADNHGVRREHVRR